MKEWEAFSKDWNAALKDRLKPAWDDFKARATPGKEAGRIREDYKKVPKFSNYRGMYTSEVTWNNLLKRVDNAWPKDDSLRSLFNMRRDILKAQDEQRASKASGVQEQQSKELEGGSSLSKRQREKKRRQQSRRGKEVGSLQEVDKGKRPEEVIKDDSTVIQDPTKQLQAAYDDARTEIAVLKDDLPTAQKNVAQAQNERDRMQADMLESERKARSTVSDFWRRNQGIAGQRNESWKIEQEALKRDRETLETERETLKRDRETLETEGETLRRDRETLERERRTLERKWRDLEDEIDEKIEQAEEIKSKDKEIETLKRDLVVGGRATTAARQRAEEAEAKVRTLEKEVKRLKENEEVYHATDIEMREFRRDMQKVGVQNKSLNKQLLDVKGELSTKTALVEVRTQEIVRLNWVLNNLKEEKEKRDEILRKFPSATAVEQPVHSYPQRTQGAETTTRPTRAPGAQENPPPRTANPRPTWQDPRTNISIPSDNMQLEWSASRVQQPQPSAQFQGGGVQLAGSLTSQQPQPSQPGSRGPSASQDVSRSRLSTADRIPALGGIRFGGFAGSPGTASRSPSRSPNRGAGSEAGAGAGPSTVIRTTTSPAPQPRSSSTTRRETHSPARAQKGDGRSKISRGRGLTRG